MLRVVRHIAFIWLICVSFTTCSTAQQPDKLLPLNRFPRMVQDWMVEQVRAAEQRGDARREALKDQADASAYVQSVQQRIRQAFGPFPEKTPLNARVMKVVDRKTYTIENIIFESRPGLMVTGNLYLPNDRSKPVPGVIGVCGHSVNGKIEKAYQSFAQGLARHGYACFIIDPIGQGERLQLLTNENKSLIGPGTGEHIHIGNQQTLVGEFLGSWFAWDGIRALDYLLSRPEIDPKHVGVTGNSGGGTQTTWLCGVEPRWTMAAPACFVTTFRRNCENELPADTEQCPPRILALDLDHSDFLAAMAPKPTMIVAQEKDYFDARGAEEAHDRLRRLYSVFGKTDATALHMGTDYHGYSQANREAMYGFFNRWTGISTVDVEPAITLEDEQTLWCTPAGQVGPLGSKSVSMYTRESSLALAKIRGVKAGAELREAVESTLKMPSIGDVPDYRILRPAGNRRYPIANYCTYAIETQPGIQALVTRLDPNSLLSRPPRGRKRAVLYVAHRSSDAELREEPLIAELIKLEPEAAFFACDVRGIGESQPDICGVNQFNRPYGSDYFLSAHSLMLDRPYLGQKTFDVLRVIQWVKAQGHDEVHLVGRGWGSLAAMFAALLSDDVKQVTLKHCLRSYAEIAESENYKWPYAVMLPGVLKHFDLPDCRAALKSKSIREIDSWGPMDGMD